MTFYIEDARREHMLKRKLVILSTLFILGGCASLESRYQRPNLPTPLQFSLKNQTLQQYSGKADSGWRAFFSDPQLVQVISIALENNRDLQTALLKVQEAAQQYRVIDANRYPQLNMSTDATYSGGLNNEPPTTRQYQFDTSISYELDFLGKLKNMSEAERQSLLASQQAQRSVQIMVVAKVAQNYLNHLLINQQLNIAQRTLDNQQQSFRFVEQRHKVGRSTLLELEQARSLVESTKSELIKREGEFAQSLNALQQIVGKYDFPLVTAPKIENLNNVDKYKIGVELPENLSSDILRQRPDIIAAEHQLIAANANIAVARAAFFPSISLTGNLTNANTNLFDLFNPASGIWQFIPKIELPIFNGGRNQSNLSLAEIRKNIAIVNYEQKIQTAFKEIADALSVRNTIQQQIDSQQNFLNSLDITLQRAKMLYRNGAVGFLDVLDAERSLFSARQLLTELKYNFQLNEITLFVALGGGWNE